MTYEAIDGTLAAIMRISFAATILTLAAYIGWGVGVIAGFW